MILMLAVHKEQFVPEQQQQQQQQQQNSILTKILKRPQEILAKTIWEWPKRKLPQLEKRHKEKRENDQSRLLVVCFKAGCALAIEY